MATTIEPQTTVLPTDWSLADLQEHLGGIPLARIRIYPPPGMATEKDVTALLDRSNRPCELIDGVLVEKTVENYESQLAVLVAHFLLVFIEKSDLGIVSGADGPVKFLNDQVRIPDVSFFRWDQFPDHKQPRSPILAVAPDLAVEILSKGNTEKEMQRKLGDYFDAGVKLVWLIDAEKKTARVYTSLDERTNLGMNGTFDGGAVLPGFKLSLTELFTRAGERA